MSTCKKIAILVPSLSNKGPIRVVQSIVTSIQRDHPHTEFTVLYLEESNEIVINCVKKKYSPTLDLREFDIVHTHGLRPDIIGYRKRRQIKKHVVTIHNFVFEDLRYTYNRVVSTIFGRLWIFVWKKADCLVTISHSMVSYYRAFYPKSAITTIHNAIPATSNAAPDPTDIKTIESFRKKDNKILGSACVVTKRKGLDQIIQLLPHRLDLAFLLIGEGKELAHLKTLADTLGVSDRCLFLGYRNDAFRYFQYFDFFVMPSRSEGFGLTLLEAARAEVPIVCSAIDTFHELFSPEEVVFFTNENIDELGAAIDKASNQRQSLVEAAHRRFLRDYTNQTLAERYFSLYHSV